MNSIIRLRKFLLVSMILVLAASTSCSLMTASYKSEELDPLTAAPAIHLTNHNGDPFELSAFQGKVVMIYFGFTNCVDECPITLAQMKIALGLLGDAAQNVQVVLVSTDPIRDTPMALQDFLGKFDPSYAGATGSLEDVSRVWDEYGVVVLDGGETHSNVIYVVDPQGRLRLRMDAEMTPDDMASDIKAVLASE